MREHGLLMGPLMLLLRRASLCSHDDVVSHAPAVLQVAVAAPAKPLMQLPGQVAPPLSPAQLLGHVALFAGAGALEQTTA